MIVKYFVLTSDIAYVSNVIESYEDIALMSTVRKIGGKSLVLFRVADDFSNIFFEIVDSLVNEGVGMYRFEEEDA